jgi:hypothetical protein
MMYTPCHRLTAYATMRPFAFTTTKINFFCDPILFAICTSKIINKLIINQATMCTITMGAFTVFTVQYVQYYCSHYVQYNYKFKIL